MPSDKKIYDADGSLFATVSPETRLAVPDGGLVVFGEASKSDRIELLERRVESLSRRIESLEARP